MRRARKKHFSTHVYHQRAMQVGPQKTKKDFQDRSLTRRNNELTQMHLQVCTVKGSCPVPDVYNCQFTMEDMTPSTCPPRTRTLDSTSMQRTLSMTLQSGGGAQPYYYDQLIAPASQAQRASSNPGRSVAAKIKLEFCSAASNTVPVYVWLLPISSDNGSLPTFSQTSTVPPAPSVSLSPPVVDLRQRRRS